MPAPPRCSGLQVCRRLPAARFPRAALPWLELRPESGVQKGTGSRGGAVLASWGCFLESLALQPHVRPWSQQEPHNRVCISGRLPARLGAKAAACLHLAIQGEGVWLLVLLQISVARLLLSSHQPSLRRAGCTFWWGTRAWAVLVSQSALRLGRALEALTVPLCAMASVLGLDPGTRS